MKRCLQRFVLVLLLSIVLLVFPHKMVASAGPVLTKSNQGLINKIVSIATHESKFGTMVNVLGNGKIPNYSTQIIEDPPKILVDIPCDAQALETVEIAVTGHNLKSLRVGHHPQKIRLVLDLKGVDIPKFAVQSADNELTIVIQPKGQIPPSHGGANEIADLQSPSQTTAPKDLQIGEVSNAKRAKKTTAQKENMSNKAADLQNAAEKTETKAVVPNDAPSTKTTEETSAFNQPEAVKADDRRSDTAVSANQKPLPAAVALEHSAAQNHTAATDAKETRYAFRILKSPEVVGSETLTYQNNLTQAIPDDGRDDTAFMIESLNAYEAKDWLRAIENLTHLIKTYNNGRYAERAYFLLANAYAQQHSQSVPEHLDELKQHYEEASYKYPTSEYLPEAFLGIGNLYYKIGNYYEALAYYNLTARKAKGSNLAATALIQKIKIMLRTEKKREALSASAVLEEAVSRLPDTPVKTEAKIIRAKMLYEFNKFQESLAILSELLRDNPENIYRHPIISLYLGYNYFQLEDNAQSRENLLRFYNSSPGQEMNCLILTQIGDTYRNEGRIKQAIKFYQLVLKRYPKTEGSVISKIRLAELQEDRSYAAEKKIVKPFNILDEDMALATEFYKDIINNSANRQNETPLTQLALLKLSIIHQKEKEYKKSLGYLKTLFEEYPRSKLKKEGRRALAETIKGMLKKDQQKKRYTNIINFYLEEKELITTANDPDLFLLVGRAFMHQNFEEMGTKMFKKAEPLLTDNEKPPDLLFLLGQDFYKQEMLKSALTRFSLLIDRHPSDKNVPYAYRLKGDILSKQKKYTQAAEMFSAALKYPASKCQQLSILIDKAKALAKGNSNAKAQAATKTADISKSACSTVDHHIYQEIGDLYFGLGDTQKAVAIYNQAIVMAIKEADKISLMLKAAQCYLRLNKKEDFLALNEKITSFNDPFWSNLAKEKMEEINFNWEMKKTKAALKKGEKI